MWIFDTGANDHIIFTLTSFVSYHTITPLFVSLPNGSTLMAHISGSVHICPNLTLHHVLYIPLFHVNLIFIPKLSPPHNYFLQFNSNTCHILQNNTKAMIGIAK